MTVKWPTREWKKVFIIHLTDKEVLSKHRKELVQISNKKTEAKGFPGGPVVKTMPSNAEGAGSIPGLGSGIPHASQPKNQNMKQKQSESVVPSDQPVT